MKTTRRNLLKGGGKAVAAAATLPVIPNIAAGASQDAELLRLNAEYRTLLGEINAGKHYDADGDLSAEATDRRDDLERKIADTPAETVAGVATKIRVAIVSFMAMCECAGIEMADDALPLKMLNGVADDAARLAGGSS